eukprot:3954741-Alexandrium_andersonii.AAC.1
MTQGCAQDANSSASRNAGITWSSCAATHAQRTPASTCSQVRKKGNANDRCDLEGPLVPLELEREDT